MSALFERVIGAAAVALLGLGCGSALAQPPAGYQPPAGVQGSPDYHFDRREALSNIVTAGPVAEREALRGFILSTQHGAPDYGSMTPDLAASVQRQAPALVQKVRALGDLKSIYPAHTAHGQPRVYKASFQNGDVAFAVGPLSDTGRLTELAYQVLP